MHIVESALLQRCGTSLTHEDCFYWKINNILFSLGIFRFLSSLLWFSVATEFTPLGWKISTFKTWNKEQVSQVLQMKRYIEMWISQVTGRCSTARQKHDDGHICHASCKILCMSRGHSPDDVVGIGSCLACDRSSWSHHTAVRVDLTTSSWWSSMWEGIIDCISSHDHIRSAYRVPRFADTWRVLHATQDKKKRSLLQTQTRSNLRHATNIWYSKIPSCCRW